MSQRFSASAEWEPLGAVRLHEPGLETWGGSLDPASNLFEAPLPPEQAREAHQEYAAALESAGVTVHRLSTDLENGGRLEEIVRERVRVPSAVDLEAIFDTLDARELLQLALARAEIEHGSGEPAGLSIRAPISNIYFQRDTTILGDKGPILCDMASTVRQPEIEIVREAWEAIGAEIVHEATVGPIEGGEFIPAGDFALLGVSAVVDGSEEVIRTSRAAGVDLLDSGALGFDQVGLVRAPLETDREIRAAEGGPSRMMHLLGWFNIAAEGVAVTFRELAQAATVEVFERRAEGYERVATPTLWEFLQDRGFDVIEADRTERWPTNFVAVDDGEILPLYEPGPEGGYRPEKNPTIESLREIGVEIHPDGEGLANSPLTNGAGGFHCMTTPVRRG